MQEEKLNQNPNVILMSNLFVKTLREDPVSAETEGHKLLLRAGYISQTGFGIYNWLPFGMKLRNKIEKIIREEMHKIGAQEVLLPALIPSEYYKKSGRWAEYGDTMFRLKDRKKNDYLLAPTHEEMFTQLAKNSFSSYKDLPKSMYQIQTKYRDELRSKGGLLRTREFVMKDSYSFDVDQEGLQKSYNLHRKAYKKIFSRLGIKVDIVSALSGPMGGSMSEEFLAESPIGEDHWAANSNGYCANTEKMKVASPKKKSDFSKMPGVVEVITPDCSSIEDVVKYLNESGDIDKEIKPENLLKIVLLTVHVSKEETADKKIIAIGVPGDREIDPKRLEIVLNGLIPTMTTSSEVCNYLDIVPGFIGPQVLGCNSKSESSRIPFYVDPRVVDGTMWVTGGNQKDTHLANVVMGRDFHADGTMDVCNIKDGDPAPDGSGPIKIKKGIELGHIFALGKKYTKSLDLKVLDQNGKLVHPEMGSYGIGVSRIIAALAELNRDENGLAFKGEVTPSDVHAILLANGADEKKKADKLVGELSKMCDIIYDERKKMSAGIKFKDADLIGAPYQIILGNKIKENVIEIVERATGERKELSLNDSTAEEIFSIVKNGF